MPEKSLVLYDLRLNYKGPLKLEEFLSEIDHWIDHHEYDKEQKKHLERVLENGKELELIIEAFKPLSDIVKSIIVLRVVFKNVKDIIVAKNGKKVRAAHADIFLNIDAFIESRFSETWWHGKVIYQVLRTLIDKFIYNFWTFKYDGVIKADCHSLFKDLRSFLSLQKYHYQDNSKDNKLFKEETKVSA